MSDQEKKRYLRTEEVATLCRTSPSTLRYWRSTGTGPPSFRLGRRVLYAADAVSEWLAEQETSARGAR